VITSICLFGGLLLGFFLCRGFLFDGEHEEEDVGHRAMLAEEMHFLKAIQIYETLIEVEVDTIDC